MTLIASITPRAAGAAIPALVRSPLGLDLWEVHEDHAVGQVTEAQAERLEQMGYLVEQVQTTEAFVSTFASDADADTYHSAASLEDDLRRLAEEHPDLAELHEIGRSVEGRPLWALRVGTRRPGARKIVILGCHHAREWVAVEVPYLIAEHLVTNASTPPIDQWLQQDEIWVAPMVNPDGHEYTQTHDRLWRKNRRPNPGGSIGVDPNRNYGYMWGVLDVATSSHVPGDQTYVGPRAFSEPETRAVRDLVARGGVAGVVTYHSYSQLILWPWGYTDRLVPDATARQDMETMARDMQAAIRDVHGRSYTPQQSSALYPTAGDTTDWTYGEYDVPSLTVELRPATATEGGFILPPSQIRPTWEENLPAALGFVDHVLTKQP